MATALIIPVIAFYLMMAKGVWKKILIFLSFIIVSLGYVVSVHELLLYLNLSGNWITLILWPLLWLVLILIYFLYPYNVKFYRNQEIAEKKWDSIPLEVKNKAAKEMFKSSDIRDKIWAFLTIQNRVFAYLLMAFVGISVYVFLQTTGNMLYKYHATFLGIAIIVAFFIFLVIVYRGSDKKGEGLIKKYIRGRTK